MPGRGAEAKLSLISSISGGTDDAMKPTTSFFSARLILRWSFAVSVALLFGCKGNTGSPTQPDETSSVSHTLGDLEVSVVDFSASYNGFPLLPFPPPPASVAVTIRLHNSSATQAIDTLIIDHAILYDKSTQQVIFTFSFDMISNLSGSDWPPQCGI